MGGLLSWQGADVFGLSWAVEGGEGVGESGGGEAGSGCVRGQVHLVQVCGTGEVSEKIIAVICSI